MAAILIIGYGNPIRGDDAVGLLAARELESYFRDDDEIEVIAARQLMPEMAETIARSGFVLFVDASREQPGRIRSTLIDPHRSSNGCNHHLTPASLLMTAEHVYQGFAIGMILTLGGWSFDVGEALSPSAQKSLPELVRQAKDVVAQHRAILQDTIDPCLPAE